MGINEGEIQRGKMLRDELTMCLKYVTGSYMKGGLQLVQNGLKT